MMCARVCVQCFTRQLRLEKMRHLRLEKMSYHSQTISVSRKPVENQSVTVVSINHPPVNSFNIPLTAELTTVLREIEDSKQTHGIIITSSLSKTFSAGLDLNDLYQQPEEHLNEFWNHVQSLWFQLYSSKLPTVAAINGHCLAGGTIVAAACDYRVAIEGDYGIGVTAAKIGVVAPPWFLKMLTHLMGQRQTELALQCGKVFSPLDAKAIGLIDEVCLPCELEDRSVQAITPYLKVSQEARAVMKQSLRAELVNGFLENREKDQTDFVSYILKDSVQKNLQNFIERLKTKV